MTLPDKVGDWPETLKLIESFPGALSYDAPWHWMAVVQQDPEASLFEWALAYSTLAQSFAPGWIAFPRILGSRRVELIAGLQLTDVWDGNTIHHAFGMNAGELDELAKLNTLNVYSCDSSAPVWRGLCGYTLLDSKPWPDVPFDPHYDIDRDPLPDVTRRMQLKQLADYNLAGVMKACQQKWEMPSPIKAARTW